MLWSYLIWAISPSGSVRPVLSVIMGSFDRGGRANDVPDMNYHRITIKMKEAQRHTIAMGQRNVVLAVQHSSQPPNNMTYSYTMDYPYITHHNKHYRYRIVRVPYHTIPYCTVSRPLPLPISSYIPTTPALTGHTISQLRVLHKYIVSP